MIIDVKGLPCPEPLLKVKQFLDENPGKGFEILLDTQSSYENVGRFLKSKNVEYRDSTENGVHKFTVSGEVYRLDANAAGICVTAVLTSDTIGRGDDELGRVLMHAFLKTLPEISPKVTSVIFMNSGVKLACGSSDFIPALKKLQSQGVDILVCGTCLDFFNLKNDLKCGKVSNMFEICTLTANSDRVLKF